jgi:large subunit ribosomal protein L10
MKKVGLLYRERIVDQICQNWSKSEGCIFVGFDKVSALTFNELRNELKKEDSNVLVSKNSLIKKALSDLDSKTEQYQDYINANTGMVFFGTNGVVNTCKILVDFSKENKGLELRGGCLQDEKLETETLQELAELPSREVLLAKSVYAMAAPLSGFVAALNNITLKFLWAIEAIKKNKKE